MIVYGPNEPTPTGAGTPLYEAYLQATITFAGTSLAWGADELVRAIRRRRQTPPPSPPRNIRPQEGTSGPGPTPMQRHKVER